MLGRHWSVICLAVALASGPVLGQGGTPEVSIEGNGVEGQEPNQAQPPVDYRNGAPLPVVIVETPQQAAHAAEREGNADQHEAADLQAQRDAADGAQRAAASAERQEIPAWVQLLLASLGTIIAVVAAITSVVTALRQDDTARKQLRAYVAVADFDLVIDESTPVVTAKFKNSGQTPAYRVRIHIGITDTQPAEDLRIDETEPYSTRDIGAGAEAEMSLRWEAFSGAYRQRLLTGNEKAWFHGVAAYSDVFGREHFTWFKSMIEVRQKRPGSGSFEVNVHASQDGNHST